MLSHTCPTPSTPGLYHSHLSYTFLICLTHSLLVKHLPHLSYTSHTCPTHFTPCLTQFTPFLCIHHTCYLLSSPLLSFPQLHYTPSTLVLLHSLSFFCTSYTSPAPTHPSFCFVHVQYLTPSMSDQPLVQHLFSTTSPRLSYTLHTCLSSYSN